MFSDKLQGLRRKHSAIAATIVIFLLIFLVFGIGVTQPQGVSHLFIPARAQATGEKESRQHCTQQQTRAKEGRNKLKITRLKLKLENPACPPAQHSAERINNKPLPPPKQVTQQGTPYFPQKEPPKDLFYPINLIFQQPHNNKKREKQKNTHKSTNVHSCPGPIRDSDRCSQRVASRRPQSR